jgi:hypothetical protein
LIILHLLRLFEVLGFVGLRFATMIGGNKSLLRLLVLRSLAPWGKMPWVLIGRSQMLSMESDKEADAMESDTGPKVLCRNLLVCVLLS